ncbi:GTP-binding protein [Agrobacterium pusense]|uniref:CobW family GTP-binding protein n=1 Tax=Agrobacterium pusense TaxID=648995 RepID=UPI0035A6BD89
MEKIPVTIITGFLGAGKTTLLNRIVLGAEGQRLAIVVNEYGEVGIDGQLVVETKDEVVELNNGCICCTVRSDLVTALTRLVSTAGPLDRIVIETSGLADPAPVIQSFVLEEELKARLKIDAIVTVVDALHLPHQLSQDEAVEQIAFADLLLLNKSDLVDGEGLSAIEQRVRALNPLAKIVQTKDCSIDPLEVLGIDAFDLNNILAIDPNILEEHDHEHDDAVGCVAIVDEGLLDPALFNAWLNRLVQEIGADLFRMKGVLSFANEARRYVFHGVHMTLEGRPGKPWKATDVRKSELVFIGRHLNEAALRSGFEACLAAPRALAS